VNNRVDDRPGGMPGAGGIIKAVHLTDLRDGIDAARVACGLSRSTWTDPLIVPGVTPVKAEHVTEARTALTEAYGTCQRTPPGWTNPALAAGTGIKAEHFMELEDAANMLTLSDEARHWERLAAEAAAREEEAARALVEAQAAAAVAAAREVEAAGILLAAEEEAAARSDDYVDNVQAAFAGPLDFDLRLSPFSDYVAGTVESRTGVLNHDLDHDAFHIAIGCDDGGCANAPFRQGALRIRVHGDIGALEGLLYRESGFICQSSGRDFVITLNYPNWGWDRFVVQIASPGQTGDYTVEASYGRATIDDILLGCRL